MKKQFRLKLELAKHSYNFFLKKKDGENVKLVSFKLICFLTGLEFNFQTSTASFFFIAMLF